MSDIDALDERQWEKGWEGHSLEQQRRLARLTLAEKLEWLESAQKISDHLARARAGENAEPSKPQPDET